MRFEQLEYILMIDEYKSINKAARQLFISPQALWASLIAVEDELGFPIFIRNSKGVELTYQGKKIVNDGKEILSKMKNWQNFSDNKSLLSGTLNVASAMTQNYIMKDIIIKIHEQFPKLTISYKIINFFDVFYNNKDSGLNEGVFLAVSDEIKSERAYSDIKRKGYEIIELGVDKLAVFISGDNPLSQQAKLTVDDLKDLTLALSNQPEQDDFFGRRLVKYFANGITFRFNSLPQVLDLVAENKAVTFGTYSTYKDNEYFARYNIKAVPLDSKDAWELVHFVFYPLKKELSPAEKMLVDELVSRFGKLKEEGILT